MISALPSHVVSHLGTEHVNMVQSEETLDKVAGSAQAHLGRLPRGGSFCIRQKE